jgi:hypothetical protein
VASKLGPGEKFLQHILVPALGSNPRFVIGLPDVWKGAEPAHPFIERYERPGGWSGSRRPHVVEDVIDLSAIFDEGLEFVPSESSAGVQLADVVAYSVRQAVLHPHDELAQEAYDVLRPKLRNIICIESSARPSQQRPCGQGPTPFLRTESSPDSTRTPPLQSTTSSSALIKPPRSPPNCSKQPSPTPRPIPEPLQSLGFTDPGGIVN